MENTQDSREFLQSLVIFFQPRDGKSAITADYFLYWEMLIWSKAEERLHLEHQVERFEDYWSRLKKSLKSGGIVLRVNRAESRLTIETVGAPGYEPPKRMLCLDVAGGTKQVELTQKIHYESGDHFIIPVDQHSEDILQTLLTTLQLLPADRERNVFHVIARPSIELRMRNVETRINDLAESLPRRGEGTTRVPAPSGAVTNTPVPAGGGFHWLQWSRQNWVLLTIIFLGLTGGGGALYWYRLPLFRPGLYSIETQSKYLLDAVSSSTSPPIKKLAENRLQEVSYYAPRSLKTQFAFEVLKLELVTRNLLPKATKELADSGVLELFRDHVREIPERDSTLVAWLSCQSFDEPNMSSSMNITHIKDCHFDKGTQAEVPVALQDLTNAVSNFSEPAEPDTPFASEAKALIAAMRESPRQPVMDIYKTHLRELGKNPFKSDGFAYAVLKLELLRLGILGATSPDITSSQTQTESAAAIQNPRYAEKITKGRNTLTAYVLCQLTAFPGVGNKIAIPGVGATCSEPDEIRRAAIKAGFETLTQYAQSYPQ